MKRIPKLLVRHTFNLAVRILTVRRGSGVIKESRKKKKEAGALKEKGFDIIHMEGDKLVLSRHI